MAGNNLYTVFKSEIDSKGEIIRVKPTEHLLGLEPHQAIRELHANVEAVADQVKDYSKRDLNVPGQGKKLRNLMFELEVARGYLMQAFKAWQAIQ